MARDGEGVWRVLPPHRAHEQAIAVVRGFGWCRFALNSGKVDYTWVSAFDRIVVNLDSFGNYASREQQEVELGAS